MLPLELQSILLLVAYIVSAVLFIFALRGLSSQESARRGNLYGIVGMIVAIAATLSFTAEHTQPSVFAALAIGAAIGGTMALRVGMTQMPEMVAMLHSFVGLAAVLVGWAIQLGPLRGRAEYLQGYIDVFIGAGTTTGSVLAFLKLRGSVSGKPLLLPARHAFNASMMIAIVVLGVIYGSDHPTWALGASTAISSVLGVHLVAAIGGAD